MLLLLVNKVYSSGPSAQQRVWHYLLKDTFKLKSEIRTKMWRKLLSFDLNDHLKMEIVSEMLDVEMQ